MSVLKQLGSALALTGKVVLQGRFWSTLGRCFLHPPLFIILVMVPVASIMINPAVVLGMLYGGRGIPMMVGAALAILGCILLITPLLMRTLCPAIARVVVDTMELDIPEVPLPSFARFVGAWFLLLLICILLAIPMFFIPKPYAYWIMVPLFALVTSGYQVRCSLCVHAEPKDRQAVVAETMFYRTLFWCPLGAIPLYLYDKGEKLFKGLFVSEYEFVPGTLSKVIDILGVFGGLAVLGVALALWAALSLHALVERRQFLALTGSRPRADAAPAAVRSRAAVAEPQAALSGRKTSTMQIAGLALLALLLIGAAAAWSARLTLLNEYLGATDPDYGADVMYRPEGLDIDQYMGVVFARSACQGRMPRIKKLLRFGVKPGQGNLDAALQCAARNSQYETARFMIDKGADVNGFARDTQRSEREPGTALQFAVSRKDARMVNELLAAGAQPDLQEKGADGRMRPAALHFAAMNKDTAMIAVLIGAGAQRGTPGPMAPVFYFMEASAPAAHGARANWSAEITVAERAGLSMNDLDETGGTLLHWAAGRGEVALLELLLERRVDRLRQDAGGAFAFQHMAAWYENRTSEPGPDFDFVLKALAAGVPDINAPAKLRQPVMGGTQTESNWTIARAAVAKPRVRAVFGKDINYAMLDASASQMGWPFKDRLEAEQLLADLSPAQIGTALALPAALRARGWDDLAQLAERKR